MRTAAPSALVHDRDQQLVHHHVGRAVGRAGLTRADRDDLEQEALFQLVRRIRQYDADRGPRDAFVAVVTQQAVSRVVEHRRAARRDWRRSTSLDAEIVNGHSATTIAESVADDDHARRTRGARMTGPERDDLRLDVNVVVERLPAQLRVVCDLLMKHGSTDAAKALGVPRGTFHDMVRRVRAEFREAGLCAYLAAAAGGRG